MTLAALLVGALLAAARQQARSEEGFLILMLLKNRIQIERIQADIETGEQEIEINRQVIETAEKKLRNAMETSNRQASIVPANDLRRGRAAKRDLAKAQAQRKEALAGVERIAAVLKERMAPDLRPDPDRRIIAMGTSVSESAKVFMRDGTKAALKGGRAGFLGLGDEISSEGSGRIEVQALDGRAVIQLHAGAQLKIDENDPQSQTLRLVQGKLSAAVERPEDLDRRVRERLQGPADDLTPLLQRYRDSAAADNARSGGRALRILVPEAVCSVSAARFDIEIRSVGMTEIAVQEGSVEVGDLKGEKRVLVEEGYRVTVTKDGISAPLKKTL
jgi:hypothetical protein